MILFWWIVTDFLIVGCAFHAQINDAPKGRDQFCARTTRALRSFRGIDQAGATMMQFALVLPVLILFILSIIDFSQYQFTKRVLELGVIAGANVTQTIPNMDNELAELTTTDANYFWYRIAKDRTLSIAKQHALVGFLHDSNATTGVHLLNYTMTEADVQVGGGSVPQYARSALILRPGESATYVDCNGNTKTVEHPTLKASDVTPTTRPTQPMMIKIHPYVVEMRACVPTLIPMVGTLEVVSRKEIFREAVAPVPLYNILNGAHSDIDSSLISGIQSALSNPGTNTPYTAQRDYDPSPPYQTWVCAATLVKWQSGSTASPHGCPSNVAVGGPTSPCSTTGPACRVQSAGS